MQQNILSYPNREKHITWIDSAKGIAVYLIMVGHLLNSSNLLWANKLIYSFHIPFFFIAAGFFIRERNDKWQHFLLNKAKRLLVPYVIYILASIPFGLFYGDYTLTFDRIIYYNSAVYFNEPLWFLIVLMEVYVIDLVLKVSKHRLLTQCIILSTFIIIGFILHEYRWGYAKPFNHFGINRATVAYAFFVIGSILRKLTETKSVSKTNLYVAGLISACIWIPCSLSHDKPSMYIFVLHNYPLFLIGGLAGSILLLVICYLWIDTNWLRRLSKYGILFMGVQYFWLIPFRDRMTAFDINKTEMYSLFSFIIPILMAFVTVWLFDQIKRKVPIIKYLNGET